MTDSNDKTANATLTVSKPLKLSLNRPADASRSPNLAAGRSKTVTVEVRKTRAISRDETGKLVQNQPRAAAQPATEVVEEQSAPLKEQDLSGLTRDEFERRKRVLERANESRGAEERKREEERRQMEERQRRRQDEAGRKRDEEARIAAELAAAAATAAVDGGKVRQPVVVAPDADAVDVHSKDKGRHKRRLDDEFADDAEAEAKKVAAGKKRRGKGRGFDDDLEEISPAAAEEEDEIYIPRMALLEGDEFEDYSEDDIPEEAVNDIVAVADVRRDDAREDVVRRVHSSSKVIMAAPDLNKMRRYLLSEAPTSPKRPRRIEPLEAQPSAVASGDKKIGTSKKRRGHKPTVQEQNIVLEVVLPESISVSDLANRMAVRGVDVIKSLMKMGVMATPQQMIDADTAELIIGEFGHKPKRVSDADVEMDLFGDFALSDDQKQPRAPVVTVMGHVDHGKTSLLDAIRKTNVVSGEAGGITQHIGAYQVALPSGQKITFLDTPGHEAFTAMRARGAKVTDVVILVVAADDGIMPQTVEAIHHAKAAGVPIVVACNKVDKPGANPERIRQELMQHELVSEEFGGDVMVVNVSAKTGQNMEQLLEAVLLQAEVLDLKAHVEAPARGIVIEARMDKGRGVVATLLVQQGTLQQGDIVVAGSSFGNVRALLDDRGGVIASAGPAMPVEVLGLSEVPVAGENFAVAANDKQARDVTEYRKRKEQAVKQGATTRITLDQLFSDGRAKVKELPLIVKGDVHGSVEAIAGSLDKIESNEVKVRIIHSGVGGITESDIALAQASNAVVIGFNVRANNQAKQLAEREKIDIHYYSIIYELIDSVKKALSGMLAPEFKENMTGYAEIRQVFTVTKAGKVAGCMVTQGIIKRSSRVRLLRDNVVIHEGSLKTLKRFKDDAKEVREGFECGMAFEHYDDIRPGDQIEAFELEQVVRSIS